MIAVRIGKTKKITLNDLLVCCFVFWPFFWNVWGVIKYTSPIAISLYTLWVITALMVLFSKRFKKSFLYIWFLFLGVIAIESISRPRAVISDLSVILCGILFCILMVRRKADYRLILKCLCVCGIIISLSVILDSTLGLFRNVLINLYTDQSREVKLRLTATGGLLPYNASAGCFIYSGMAAYVALTKLKQNHQKQLKIENWIVMLLFGIAALLIQKRGFIIDTVVAVAGIMVLRIKKGDMKTIQFQKLFKRMISLVAILLVLVLVYSKVSFVREALDSLIERFTTSDDTYSGRTDLYELAFALYRGHTWTGIGWGRYRINTLGIFGLEDMTYAVHNVYIQLLCETGVIGLAAFLVATVSTIIHGIKKYRKFVKAGVYCQERIIVELGIFLQLFFLAYCMSGNPLYDYNFCITYFIGIVLTLIPFSREGVQGLCA